VKPTPWILALFLATAPLADASLPSWSWDEAGNLSSSKLPGRAVETFSWDALGNLLIRTDEENENTVYDYDPLGRLRTITYVDGTFEELRYEDGTGLVAGHFDRAEVWTSFVHDGGGRLIEIHKGETPAGAASLLVKYEYDATGRPLSERNRDAGVLYEDHDFAGRPRITRTVRYEGQTGLSDSPQVLDGYSQRHVWNVFGERESWTMPVAKSEPLAAADAEAGVVLRRIVEERDGAGNLTAIRDGSGEEIATSTPRSVGRLKSRGITVDDSPNLFTTTYDYWDGTASSFASGASNLGGLRRSAVAEYEQVILGGSTNLWNDIRKLERSVMPATDRGSLFAYDGRGRLEEVVLGRPAETLDSFAPSVETLTPSDFRLAKQEETWLSTSQLNDLGEQSYAIERPSWTMMQLGAHRTGAQVLALGELPEREYEFEWDRGRRTSDGRWASEYDDFGRVTALEKADGSHRIEYVYDARDRIVGRLSSETRVCGWRSSSRPPRWKSEQFFANRVNSDRAICLVFDHPELHRFVGMLALPPSKGAGAPIRSHSLASVARLRGLAWMGVARGPRAGALGYALPGRLRGLA
jgi:YD repeat-containing protein